MNEDPKSGNFLNNKQYDAVKFLTVTLLPALGTLYFALGQTWGLPHPQEVMGTLLAIQAFIGVVMHISTNQYESSGAKYSGEINIAKQPNGEKKASVVFNQHPAELDDKADAIFKVHAPKE